MHGSFVWNELSTADLERAKDFYGAILGWTYEKFDLPDGEYWIARNHEGTVIAGLGTMAIGSISDAKEPYWFSFVEVDDVDRRLATAMEFGAAVERPPEDVPNVGRVAIVRDPTGALLGWISSPDGEAVT